MEIVSNKHTRTHTYIQAATSVCFRIFANAHVHRKHNNLQFANDASISRRLSTHTHTQTYTLPHKPIYHTHMHTSLTAQPLNRTDCLGGYYVPPSYRLLNKIRCCKQISTSASAVASAPAFISLCYLAPLGSTTPAAHLCICVRSLINLILIICKHYLSVDIGFAYLLLQLWHMPHAYHCTNTRVQLHQRSSTYSSHPQLNSTATAACPLTQLPQIMITFPFVFLHTSCRSDDCFAFD